MTKIVKIFLQICVIIRHKETTVLKEGGNPMTTNNTKTKLNAETASLKLLIEELSLTEDYNIIRQLRSIIIRYLEKRERI